ncbi:MAG TPA: CBS domain-containing protein [Chloroflexota bacterium]
MATRTLYLSQIIGKPVLDPEDRPVGILGDLVVRLGGPFPPVTGLTLRLGGIGKTVDSRATYLHWGQVASVSLRGVSLSSVRLDLRTFLRRHGELLLRADLLDQQVMDLHGRKLVRVNDVQLACAGANGTDLRLAGIDVGARGLLRRLDLDSVASWLSGHTRLDLPDRVIPWESIDPVDLTELNPEGEEDMQSEQVRSRAEGNVGGAYEIQLSHEKLSALHPADVADLVEQLSAPERAAVLDAMEPEDAAETLGELEPEMQGDVLEDLPTDAAVEILAELPPDEAADALAEVSKERAEELLDELGVEDMEAAETVRQLMSFEEDVAGGMMNTSYVALSSDLTAQATIDTLRNLAPPAEEVYYVYVVDQSGMLVGVLSLRDLIVSDPGARIADIIREQSEVVSVPVDLPQEEVLRVFDKYNLLAVPVTDETGRLVGVVTIDDALATVMPDEPRRRSGVHR